MYRSRFTRVIALLVLILAQAALMLPRRMMAETVTASAPAAGATGHESCHGAMAQTGGEAGRNSHSPAPMPPCGSCPASMPGTTCVQMVSCGPSSASPAALSATLLPTVASADIAPTISSPAAHDFIPDPPPPRA